jgi:cytochrome c oxidase assembly factor CtaG
VSPVAREALASWAFPPYVTAAVIVTAVVYARGFRRLHAQMPERFPSWRVASFMGGLGALLIAIASPIAAFDDLLLQVHMVQHMLLMFVAPPLILAGAPQISLLRGLPIIAARRLVGPLLKSRTLAKIADFLAHPLVCWLALAIATWTWHAPGPYQLALRSERWHEVEHWCFIAAAMLFWWPVVQPWPSRPRWPRWTMLPYLLLADAQNTVLSALLTFSERVIYPFYEGVPRVAGITPLNDQIAAGLIMWVPGSLFFLVPGALIIFHLLSGPHTVDPRTVVGSKREDWDPITAHLARGKGKGAGS